MKKKPLRIIPLARGHVKACAAIVAASEPWRTLGIGIDFSRLRTRSRAYVCTRGDTVAGFVLFTPEPVFARGGYLRAIGVSPALRRHGIGKRLLRFVEAMTAEHSPNLYLCVSSFNRTAQAFYRSRGYRKIGSIPGLIVPGAAEHIFWKRLKPKTKPATR